MSLQVQNTLSGKKEEFLPLHDKEVGMYNCGPTVYHFAHIGNMRAYIFADTIKRVLQWNGYKVHQVMNITDVGHLTDNDEDKMERAAHEQRKSAREIAKFYSDAFFDDLRRLNIDTFGTIFPRATNHIPEQIGLIEELSRRGFTYKTSDGIYFNTSLFLSYGSLGNINLRGLEEGARIEINPEKKNRTDFALWKFSKPEDSREQEWDSPWGRGFPGWHIECSAMSMRYLGETIDIHTGGADLIFPHHNDEIAQSEAATDRPFVRYWLHSGFVTIGKNEEKMSKSLGNVITISDIVTQKIHPLAYRYFVLGTHYSKPLTFTFEALEGAAASYEKILREALRLIHLRGSRGNVITSYTEKFTDFINDDFDTPKALALIHALIQSKENDADRLATLLAFDSVLGLDIERITKQMADIPSDIKELYEEREIARNKRDFAAADQMRKNLEDRGYNIYDFSKGSIIERKLSSLL